MKAKDLHYKDTVVVVTSKHKDDPKLSDGENLRNEIFDLQRLKIQEQRRIEELLK